VVLKTTRFGEIHKQAVLLTERFGILHAAAYGACKGKSRLSGVIEQFNSMVLMLYHEPVKNNYKIQEAVDVVYHEGIKTSLAKFAMASLVTEVVLKSYGAGEHRRTFLLTAEALGAIDRLGEEDLWYGGIQFLWRFFHIAGFSPALDSCIHCGYGIVDEERIYYSNRQGGFTCADCTDTGTVSLSAGSVRYLRHTESLPLMQAIRVRLADRDRNQLRIILTGAAETLLETPLKSLSVIEEPV
jgi:DNA repair protein RecO